MQAKLASRQQVADNAFEAIFSLPSPINFEPGQYVTITLPTLRNDPAGNRRIFSLVNPPSQNKIVKILYRFRPSPYKKLLQSLPSGSVVEVSPPQGNFSPISYKLPAKISLPVVFLAAGVGIAPFMSMLAPSAVEGKNYPATLFYTNKSPASAPYLDKISKNANLIFTTKDKRLDINLIKAKVSPWRHALYYIAGSPEFVEDLEAQLIAGKIPPKNIHRESFDGY